MVTRKEDTRNDLNLRTRGTTHNVDTHNVHFATKPSHIVHCLRDNGDERAHCCDEAEMLRLVLSIDTT